MITSLYYTSKKQDSVLIFSCLLFRVMAHWFGNLLCLLPKNFVEWSGFPLKKFVKNNFVLAFFGILPQFLNYYVVTFSSLVRHFVSLCFRDLSINQFYFNFLHCLRLIYLFSASELGMYIISFEINKNYEIKFWIILITWQKMFLALGILEKRWNWSYCNIKT